MTLRDLLGNGAPEVEISGLAYASHSVTPGALYPALHRLEQQGWLRARWRKTDTGRDAKFYTLTRAGRAQLDKELAQWDRLSGAIGLVIRMAEH